MVDLKNDDVGLENSIILAKFTCSSSSCCCCYWSHYWCWTCSSSGCIFC